MIEVLDQATWLRTKSETLLTSLPSKGELLYITSDIIDEEDNAHEVLSRDAHEELQKWKERRREKEGRAKITKAWRPGGGGKSGATKSVLRMNTRL